MSACAELVERGDPERFLAVMSAPVAQRDALFTVLAYNLEVARAPWLTKESMIAEMRLQWWRDILAEAQEGAPARAHEVAAPLHQLIRGGLDIAPLDQLAEARRWDIYSDPFDDWAAFDAHINATSGALFAALCQAVGGTPNQALADLAYASGVAGWLRAIPDLEASGKLPVPDGRPQAIADLAQRALDRLAQARGARFGVATPVARMAWLAGPVLRNALRDPQLVAAGGLAPSEAGQRLGLIWRSLRMTW